MIQIIQEILAIVITLIVGYAFMEKKFQSPLKKAEEKLAEVILLKEHSRKPEDDV